MTPLPVAVALVHYPVLDRRGDIVTTAVTNLDLHDIARSGRTFGIERFYVVTPIAEQQGLMNRLLDHWQQGHGASYNPDRKAALQLVEMAPSLEEALTRWQGDNPGTQVLPLLTAAGRTDGLPFFEARKLRSEAALLIVLGTGSGLAPELFVRDWPVLQAIHGAGNYNHLSVRAAAAIIFDRLLGHP